MVMLLNYDQRELCYNHMLYPSWIKEKRSLFVQHYLGGHVETHTLYDSRQALRVSVLAPIDGPLDTHCEYVPAHCRMQFGSALLVSIAEMLYAHPDRIMRLDKNNIRFMIPPFFIGYNEPVE